MEQRKSRRRWGDACPAPLSMAKSAEAEKAGATQHSPKQRPQSARSLARCPPGTEAEGGSGSGKAGPPADLGPARGARDIATAGAITPPGMVPVRSVAEVPGVGASLTAPLCFATCGSSVRRPSGQPGHGGDLMGKATRIDELRSLSVLEGLTDDQLAELARRGTGVRVEDGADVFREGEHADFWWVLLDGAIDLVRHVGREDAVVGHMDVPGRWAGGFRAWDEHGVYLATGRARTDARVLRVPAEMLRELVAAWFPLGGHLIRGLYGTARSIESTARQRESLVTLGTLAAGLAHEINNPASAATRAVGALETACAALLSSLTRLAADEISAQQFTALDALRREIKPRDGARDPLAL